jgi:pimeloyl-ACP methyl ester carboxylesterase
MLFLFSPPLFERSPELVDVIEQALAGEYRPSLDGYAAQLDACEAHDVSDRLGEIRIPTLVMTGRRDVLLPPELSEEIAAMIPGAQLLVLESAHGLQFEEYEPFNRAVLEFLARR